MSRLGSRKCCLRFRNSMKLVVTYEGEVKSIGVSGYYHSLSCQGLPEVIHALSSTLPAAGGGSNMQGDHKDQPITEKIRQEIYVPAILCQTMDFFTNIHLFWGMTLVELQGILYFVPNCFPQVALYFHTMSRLLIMIIESVIRESRKWGIGIYQRQVRRRSPMGNRCSIRGGWNCAIWSWPSVMPIPWDVAMPTLDHGENLCHFYGPFQHMWGQGYLFPIDDEQQ